MGGSRSGKRSVCACVRDKKLYKEPKVSHSVLLSLRGAEIPRPNAPGDQWCAWYVVLVHTDAHGAGAQWPQCAV